MSVIKVNNIHTTDSVKVMSDGNFVHQNHSTISGTTTIPSGSNSLLVGPTTIATLTVNGNLNVIQSLNVTNELNIVGSISFSG